MKKCNLHPTPFVKKPFLEKAEKMDSRFSQADQKKYLFFEKLFKFRQRMKILEIDFEKPWWQIFTIQKGLVAINLLNSIIFSSTTTILPLAIGWVIETGSIPNFIYLVLGLIIYTVLIHALFYFDPLLRIQIEDSISNSASVQLLKKDPVYHTTKASGVIIAKVNRGSSSASDLLSSVIFGLVGILGMFISTIFVFIRYNLAYGLVAFGAFVIVSITMVWGTYSRIKLFSKFKNYFEDQSKQAQVETLSQTIYIRSSFSTTEQVEKLKTTTFEDMVANATRWRAGGLVITITRVVYYLGFLILGILILKDDSLGLAIKIGFLVTYLQTNQRLFDIGELAKKLPQNIEAIRDLFEFIKNFGVQSYPVLEGDEVEKLGGEKV